MVELAGGRAELGARDVWRSPSPVGGVINLLQRPFVLDCGLNLPEVQVAYEIVGPSNAPVVAVLGGISATRFVTGGVDNSATRPRGWWRDLCGPGQALDSNKYRILSWDFLGGNGATTGPRSSDYAGKTFPDITTGDQARVLAELLPVLGISSLHALVGASYGGMIALAFGAQFPNLVKRLLVISAAHRSAPLAVAWRTIQRQIVNFGLSENRGGEALALARALGMATYRTPDEFAQRFSGARLDANDPDSFPIWDYLRARGEDYVKHMDPHAFLCLSRSIDLHEADPQKICVPTTVVAVRQDQLVPLALLEELADAHAGSCELQVIDSLYGHDAFLKEPTFFSRLLRCL